MAPRPILGDIELEKVQSIIVDGDQVLVEHGIPALEGNFLQRLGRRATQINLRGFLTGPEVADGLKALRDKFRAAEPVAFVADIATATQVGDVLIEEMGVREIAGKPERFEYAFLLREFIPAPPTRSIEPPPPPVPPPPPPSVKTGVLIVEVIVEGQPNFDFNKVTVTVEGTEESGVTLSRTLTNRTENRWTENDFPPGDFTAEALVSDPDAMSGSVSAAVRAGQTTQVQITLRRGANIAKAFVVHFWFDKAFIEPCLRPIMREIAQYSADHPSEKLIIIGHTDLVGSDNYNQSLSERRGRSAYAYLTFGRDKANALDEWDQLRQNRPAGQLPSIHDTWSVREYQYMLQDIGYYIGSIDEDHGPKTDTAIRGFQQDNGLTVNGTMDNPTWQALIDAYLSQDNLSVSEDQFITNAKDECNGGIVKWLGCGEKDPVKNTQDAWRPNRRTEFLFTTVSVLPCEIPEPVTFELPQPNIVGTNWCLGPGETNKRCCFTTRETEQPDKLFIRPAKPEKTLVNGVITFEDGTPVVNAKYALIAPDGEYLHTDSNGKPDLGERPQQPNRGRPIPDRADDNGRFTYPRQTPVGTYILELFDLEEPEIAREVDDPPEVAKGNVICFELDQEPEIVQRNLDLEGVESVGATADLPQLHALVPSIFISQTVIPVISLSSSIVVFKKPHTNPVRIEVNLASVSLVGTVLRHPSGTLTRSNNISAVHLFTAATGGTEITFDGLDNVFLGADLQTGVTIFAEAGPSPSVILDDYTLTLALTPGAFPQVGPPANATITVAELDMINATNVAIPAVGDDACLMVSKFVTNVNLPNTATFDGPPGAGPDPETFRGQLRGLPAGEIPKIRLQVLRGATTPYNHTFDMLHGTIGGQSAYRINEHVRLVSNTVDEVHLAHQTPLVRLADIVKATLILNNKDLASIELPVGRPPNENGPKAIRTVDIHFVTLQGVSSAPVTTVARMSEDWAQLAIRFNLLSSVTRTSVTNVLTIDGTANANGQLSVEITPQGGSAVNIVVPILNGDTDEQMAQKLATAISAQPNLSASHHRHNDTTQNVFILLVNKGQEVTFANINTTVASVMFQEPALNFTDGITLLEGNVLGLNFRHSDLKIITIIATGKNNLVGNTVGLTGNDSARIILPGWQNLSIMREEAVDASDDLPFVAGHEMGHALFDGGNPIHSNIGTNLFFAVTSSTDTISAAKRLADDPGDPITDYNRRARTRSGPGTVPPILQKK